MNKFPNLKSARSHAVIGVPAILLYLVGLIVLVSTLLQFVAPFFVPITALAAITFATIWAVRKLCRRSQPPLSDEIEKAAQNTLRKSARITQKTLRSTAAAAKTILEELQR